MTKVTTPSQLKAELESQKTYLLEACLMAFNQLPNQRTKGAFPSTYALAAKIDHLLQQEKKISLPTTTKPG
ncbi:cobalamin biosynthesis protein CbiX [bacteria symbiont BFo1 of Frankliniella occidentalis]|nr:cobalamin biosynthesis protein CbiX [Salmonella enterica subsp. enterica serovar Senftenberg]KMV67912.1 cobalamin biosynthesis protein CbiX [bacteria symbiont BFo1 of Frankliniella occidentalis]KYP82556.1 cobalamin biosynthesis protein CbiX [bacteria symbiont BFo1 of Frankliniella occidentalis]